MNLFEASKNNWKWLKNCYDSKSTSMCCSGSDDRQGNYYKGDKNCECYVPKKNQETNIDVWGFFPLLFYSSVFIFFHS